MIPARVVCGACSGLHIAEMVLLRLPDGGLILVGTVGCCQLVAVNRLSTLSEEPEGIAARYNLKFVAQRQSKLIIQIYSGWV